MNEENLVIKIEGAGTREKMGRALRLIATALDGKGKYPAQAMEDIDGAEWLDCLLRTTLHYETVQTNNK